MGVEIQRYLLPADRMWRPDLRTLVRLVEALAARRWIPVEPWNEALRTPTGDRPPSQQPEETLEQWAEAGFVLRWNVTRCGEKRVRFPLVSAPVEEHMAYYKFQICWATDHVYRTSEVIEPFPAHLLTCTCGEGLEYRLGFNNPMGAGRIRAGCPRCARAIDVSRWPAKVIDGWSKEGRIVPGGATSRFAVIADVGKCWSRSAEERRVHRELVECCAAILGVPLVEIEDIG